MPRTTSTDRDTERPHHHHGRHRSSRKNESPAYSEDSYSDEEPEPPRSSRSRRTSVVNPDGDNRRSRSRKQEVTDDIRDKSRGHSRRREKAGIAAGTAAGAGAGVIAGKVKEKTGGLAGIKGTLINAGDIIRGSVGEIVDSTLGDEKGARHYQRMTDRGLQNLRSRTRSPGGTRIVPTGKNDLTGPPLSPHSQAQRDADMARSRADYEEGYRAGLNAAAAQMAQQKDQLQMQGPPGYLPGLQHQIQPSYLPPPQQIDNGGYQMHPAAAPPPAQAQVPPTQAYQSRPL